VSRRSVQRVLIFIAGVFASFILAGLFLRHTFSALITSVVLAYLMNPVSSILKSRASGGSPPWRSSISACSSWRFLPALRWSVPAAPDRGPPAGGTPLCPEPPAGDRSMEDPLHPYYASEEGEWLAARVTEGSRSLPSISRQGLPAGERALFGSSIWHWRRSSSSSCSTTRSFQGCDSAARATPGAPQLSEVGGRIKRSLERFIVAQFIDCSWWGCSAPVRSICWDRVSTAERPVCRVRLGGTVHRVMVAMIPAAFIGYAETGDLTIIPKVCVAYFFISVVIEGNLIKPS